MPPHPSRVCVARWQEAVQPVDGGVRLLVEVSAGAKEQRFPDGFNAWREGRIGVRVRAPAQEGRANVEVVQVVGQFFGLGPGQVKLEAGATDSRKTLALPIAQVQALELLERAFARR